IGERAYVAVLDMPSVVELASFDRKYEGLAKFPAVLRDISMIVPKTVLAGQIEEIIRQRSGKILESCELFDVYEGSQIKEGHKSMAYALSFRAKDRTLTEQEISAAMKKILNGLQSLGAELRQ
ncbi:MAG: phenylalanine--tRNA ligase subunit beta, partial [Lachnospiraceae bacterium]|nr:phenylalanine--tRNA ligase subunit beta [Lachnospiraceae bacterium]